MSTKAKGSKKGPEKSGLDGPSEKNGKREISKDAAGPAVKKKVSQVKEMFPNHNLSEKVLADSIRAVGSTNTVDLVITGQLQTTAWQTVEKKQPEKKKDEPETSLKGGGKGGGRGAPPTGRGRGFEPGRPAAMRPYSNPRPAQTAEKTDGVGGVVKEFAPVSVNTTTSKTGLSFADILKKSAAPQTPPPAILPVRPQAPQATTIVADRERPANKKHVAPAPAPAPAWPQAQGVWGQKAMEEVVQAVETEEEEEVPETAQEPAEREPETQEPEEEEEPAQQEEPEEDSGPEPPQEPEPEPPAEEEPEEEAIPIKVPEPAPASSTSHLPAVHQQQQQQHQQQQQQQPRQATAYRPPAASVAPQEKVEAPVAAAAPKKPAPRAIPQFSSEAAVVLPSHLQSKADHGFKFEAPDEDEEEEEHAPVVAGVEQVIEEPLSSSQDVQTDPFMWEAAREAALLQTANSAVQAMLPPVAPSPSPPVPEPQPIQAPVPAAVPPMVSPASVQPQPSAPVVPPTTAPPTTSPSLSPVQPPVVPAAAMMHMPSTSGALPTNAPAPAQQPQPLAPSQLTPPAEEHPYMSGMSGNDMYFGAGGPPPTQQPQQPPAYNPPPFPGVDQMGYPEPFGAYGAAYGRGKFPQAPNALQHQQQPQQQASSTPGSGQDLKSQSRTAPGPAAYGKPAGQPAQQSPPPMPAYGMPPYMPPYGMYGMYGMYGGMQGMPPQGYEAEGGYSAPGFDASKFNMAAAYYNPTYPPPAYSMPPYSAQMRPPWGAYNPAMAQGMPQDPQKYSQAPAGSQGSIGQNKAASSPPTASNAASKFGNQPRARGFGNQGYQPMRYDQPQPHYPPYYPPQPGGYSAFYQQAHQSHPHQQPGPQ